jgi:hypothetical protein
MTPVPIGTLYSTWQAPFKTDNKRFTTALLAKLNARLRVEAVRLVHRLGTSPALL